MPRRIARIAAVLLALEAVGILALAAWQVVALAGADTTDPVSAIALIVLTLLGAVAVAAFAAATWRGRSWGRSGGVVTQLLIVAVAVGALSGEFPHVGVAVALGLPAVAGLVLLFLAAREAHAQDAASGGVARED
ncbi:histidine kinase [Microbacterium sp. JZ31]|uniref:histidine kinase n=1 Tax=Microbacterium sp. JZ31 TaxID=1906274 RepID=UPI0019320407|nr:histidine kinase [Microbacterium sp. JZ31]